MIARINPKILTWARERNGFSIEELAEKAKRQPAEVQMWERGDDAPPYTCLEELAYRHLKIPIAVFFFPELPELDDPRGKFRRLPDFEFARLSHDTLNKIRIAQAYQDSLMDLTPQAVSGEKIFEVLRSKAHTPVELARKAREYLKISIPQQVRFGSCESAFKAWRHAIEDAGVFTFKDSLEDRFVSGFCLFDVNYPVIMINNSNAFSRQIFTIAHELGHLLLGVNGITDADDAYIDYMTPGDQLIEVECNQFAAELLVPHDEFRKDVSLFHAEGQAAVSRIADKYSVSREVVLRRLLDHGSVTAEEYRALSKQWNKDYLRVRQNKPGGNYYHTKLAYLGQGFAQLVIGSYRSGKITKSQAGTHLNINSKNIDKLERYIGR